MKCGVNGIVMMCFALIIAACGTEAENTGGQKKDNQLEKQKEVHLQASSTEHASILLNQFIDEELQDEEYGGLYLDQERDQAFVLQLTKETDVDRATQELEQFFSEMEEGSSTTTTTVYIDQVTYSYAFLTRSQQDLHEQSELFLTGEQPIWGSSVNVWTNQLDVDVSRKSDLDLEAMRTYFGNLDFLKIREGSLANMTGDDPAIPSSEPSESGRIKEINNETKTILIEDQLYASTEFATIVDEKGEILFPDLKVGDYVNVWLEGGILESLPAQGSAVFIQVDKKEDF